MYYDGDLGSGIAKALDENRHVVCFIRGHDAHTAEWEENFLGADDVKEALSQRAVVLAVDEGSSEASNLSMFCALSGAPQLLVIHNGKLQNNFSYGVDLEDFREELLRTLRAGTDATTGPSDSGASTRPEPSPRQDTEFAGMPYTSVYGHDAPSTSSTSASMTLSNSESVAKEAHRKQLESYNRKRREQQALARRERERILKNIEMDRRDQREMARARAERDALTETAPGVAPTQPQTGRVHGKCVIKTRLCDGAIVTKSFEPNDTLRDHVRPWVASQQGMPRHFELRQVLTPQPNRIISDDEETHTLQKLGMVPNANLVVIAPSHSAAVYPSVTGFFLFRWLSPIFSLIQYTLNELRNLLTSPQTSQPATGEKSPAEDKKGGSSAAQAKTTQSERRAAAGSSNVRIRTLRDQRDQDDKAKEKQFYNGNQLNFEPRKDDEGNVDFEEG